MRGRDAVCISQGPRRKQTAHSKRIKRIKGEALLKEMLFTAGFRTNSKASVSNSGESSSSLACTGKRREWSWNPLRVAVWRGLPGRICDSPQRGTANLQPSARRKPEDCVLHVILFCLLVSCQCFPLGNSTGNHKAEEPVYVTRGGQLLKGIEQVKRGGDWMWTSKQNPEKASTWRENSISKTEGLGEERLGEHGVGRDGRQPDREPRKMFISRETLISG